VLSRVAHPLVARGRRRVTAPLEHVAREEHRPGNDAVTVALQLRADVHEHGARLQRGGRGGRIEALEAAPRLGQQVLGCDRVRHEVTLFEVRTPG
jgi:hypothetical protein